MNYDLVGSGGPAKVAILTAKIHKGDVNKYYVSPHLHALQQEIMVCDLHLTRGKKKTPVKEIKEYLNDLLPHLQDAGIEFIAVTNSEYFKVLTKQQKTDATIGDVFQGVGGFVYTYLPNYNRIFHDPDRTKSRIQLCCNSILRWSRGDVRRMGSGIIRYEDYPESDSEIQAALERLLDMECDLTCDIETFTLKHYDAGIGTITFCWSEHEGIAFEVDNCQTKEENAHRRFLLLDFFSRFDHTMIYHNVCFDVYVLIYQLFMDHILDQEGLLYGMSVLLKDWECSQIITYLATNSCAGNELGLKQQAHEFAGNYAVENITDITQIPLEELLKYNLVDGLSTWYVYKKHLPTMVQDDQETIYRDLFKKSVLDIIQMQLTGLPLNMEKVKALDTQLKGESASLLAQMNNMKIVQDFVYELEETALQKKNAKLKKKQVTRSDLGSTQDLIVRFNPNSAPQLQDLLYGKDFLYLPVLDYTDSGLPSTGAETLEKLLNQNLSQDIKDFLQVLLEFKAQAIILSTFLPAFLRAKEGPDGWHYLFGNFRLGGTVSGRLSSNDPNLQNIPSSAGAPLKKRLATLIKECFEAPPGWLFVGLDFDSLEDKISAVTTRDPEKIKVYTDGYDGHSIRALAYFPTEMPDIEITPQGATAYRAVVDGETVYFHSEEEIEYQGVKMTGQEFYENMKGTS